MDRLLVNDILLLSVTWVLDNDSL